jgi:tRNA splicing endonuclease
MILTKTAVKGKQKISYTPVDRAYYRRERSESISDILKAAANVANDETALALAERMRQCSLKTNHYLAEDLADKNGECFNGFGNLWGCGSKLCHSCMTRSASRNRKQAREVLEDTKLVRRQYFCYVKQKSVIEQEKFRFVTLTMPKVNLSCVQTLDLLKRAWELFRKLDFTKNYFSGLVKSTEFTVRNDRTYHAHLHLLAVSVFIPEQLIKKYWFNCVQTAFNESGVKFKANAVVVNLKKVNSIDAALSEVCKYITKSDSWSAIPKAHLLEIANVRRFPRMFELTGRLKRVARRIREQKEFEKQARVEMENVANTGANYLDKNGVTDGNNSKVLIVRREHWRDLVPKIGYERYVIELENQVTAAIRVRQEILTKKYPLATFKDLTGFVWHDPNLEFIDEIPVERRENWETSPEFLRANAVHYQTRQAVC